MIHQPDRRTIPSQVLGPGLLIQLATADVAMPYNVICLTSTVLAVFFGASFNVLLQRSPRRPIFSPGLMSTHPTGAEAEDVVDTGAPSSKAPAAVE